MVEAVLILVGLRGPASRNLPASVERFERRRCAAFPVCRTRGGEGAIFESAIDAVHGLLGGTGDPVDESGPARQSGADGENGCLRPVRHAEFQHQLADVDLDRTFGAVLRARSPCSTIRRTGNAAVLHDQGRDWRS